MMVGRGVELTVAKGVSKPREAVLSVRNLIAVDATGRVAVDDVSFEVRGGEIVAVAGVLGNGQTELAEAIMGLSRGRRVNPNIAAATSPARP